MGQNFPNLDQPLVKGEKITDTWRAFLRTLWDRTGGSSGGVGVPTGQISAYGGTSAPDGWLICDGSAVSRNTFSNLFIAIGTAWGDGDGSTTFNLPDLRSRFLLGGVSSGPDTVGATGGSSEVVLTTNEMPAHNHSLTTKAHTHSVVDPGHTHTLTDPGHVHAVTDPGHTHTYTDPQHSHTIGSDTVAGAGTFVAQAAANAATVSTNPASVGITIDTATTGVSVDSNVTGITVDDAFTGITIGATAAVGTVGVAGKGLPFDIKPSYGIVNWIIKT